MPSLSQRQRRRPAYDDDNEPPRSQRRHQPVEEEEEEDEEGGQEEEEEEEEEEGEEDGEAEVEDEEEEEEVDEVERRNSSRAERRRREREQRRAANNQDDGDDDNETAGQAQTNRETLHQELLAKKLTRYALASEPRRMPIRRQAVKEQVLDNEGKHFRKVFPIAQEQLRGIFGMNMVEWPAREKATMSVRERRKALKSQKATKKTPKAAVVDRYLLVSTLPPEYQECVFAPILTDPDATEALEPANPPAPDTAYMGFVTLVVALITLNGGEMSQEDLEKLLTIVHGGRPAPARADEDFLQSVPTAMGDFVDDEDGRTGGGQQDDGTAVAGGTLQHMVRQGYLLRVVEAPTTAEGRGPVGGRGAGGSSGMPAGTKVWWHVGPRAQLEIGPQQVADVVYHIYGEDAGQDLERRLKSSLQMADAPAEAAEEGDAEGGQRVVSSED